MKMIIKGLIVIFIYIMLGLSQDTTKGSSVPTYDSCKILFIGSSYFNSHGLPEILRNLAASSGKAVYINQYMPSGLYLSDHAKSGLTDAKIKEQDWDYVVLQGVGRITAYPDYFTDHPVYPSLQTLKKKIKANCESTKMVFCMPWAYEDGMLWYGWTDTYADMQLKIYNNTLQYSDNLDTPIAPVGWAWKSVLEDLHYPLHYLHVQDWNHPSLKGSYLMACVIYSTIFQESLIGNSYLAGLKKGDATFFQTIASNIVLDNLELWNIISGSGVEETAFSENSPFLQSFPNPFSSTTRIEYELQEESFVNIAVYDGFGKKCASLIQEYQLPGKYAVSFHGDQLKSGTYYCQIKTGGTCRTKKMLLVK